LLLLLLLLQALPIAELAPFRLTRQVANVMQPHSASGLMKPAMAAWLDAAMQGQQVQLFICAARGLLTGLKMSYGVAEQLRA
jgi:hypothetical protein